MSIQSSIALALFVSTAMAVQTSRNVGAPAVFDITRR